MTSIPNRSIERAFALVETACGSPKRITSANSEREGDKCTDRERDNKGE